MPSQQVMFVVCVNTESLRATDRRLCHTEVAILGECKRLSHNGAYNNVKKIQRTAQVTGIGTSSRFEAGSGPV